MLFMSKSFQFKNSVSKMVHLRPISLEYLLDSGTGEMDSVSPGLDGPDFGNLA